MLRSFFALALSLLSAGINLAQTSSTMTSPASLDFSSFHPAEDTWLGAKRYLFIVDGCHAWVAVPNTPLPGNHWAWWMMFPDAFPERCGEKALLDRGYYVAFLDVGNTFGAPSALAHLSKFYQAMTAAGLRSKVALVGVSRGGLYAYNWTAQNPEKVSVIYGDAPVCNFASWPYAHGAGKDGGDWKSLLAVYGFKSDDEALSCPTQPFKELGPVAQAHIPLIHVVGDADTTVPVSENTAIVEKEYNRLGGKIVVLHKPGCEHHPHGLDDPTPVVDFILEHDK